VFQEDLRRAFERLAALPTVGTLRPAAEFTEVDLLVEAMADLAQRKIGALVVLKGQEPLERHVDGGILIDARVSKPLLESIFDPHSMGHDGAAILEGRRIRKFAAHLPLSKNLQEVGPRGTRHAAALGLAERSDALAIVVSEERGEISIAHRGKLTVMTAPADLKDHLDRFVDEHHPRPTRTFFTRLLRENAGLKVASLVFACLAWYLMIHKAETIQHTYTVPIEFANRPADLVIAGTTPNQATVTLRGYQRAFNLLVPSDLKFSVDLSGLAAGTYRVDLDASRLRGAADFDLDRVIPPAIAVMLERRPSASPAKAASPATP
jgi:hypothetical protein